MTSSVYTTLMKIFDLALQINNQGRHEVFFEIAPHVESISIRVFKDKWDKGIDPTNYYNIYYQNNVDELLEVKDKMVEYLIGGIK